MSGKNQILVKFYHSELGEITVTLQAYLDACPGSRAAIYAYFVSHFEEFANLTPADAIEKFLLGQLAKESLEDLLQGIAGKN